MGGSFQAGDTLVQIDSNVFEDISNHLRFLENVWEDFLFGVESQEVSNSSGSRDRKRSFLADFDPGFYATLEAKLFLDSMNSANKKVEKLMSLFPKTIGNQQFFSVFRFGSGLQWLLLTIGSPTFQAPPPAAASASGRACGGPWPSAVHDFKVPKARIGPDRVERVERGGLGVS